MPHDDWQVASIERAGFRVEQVCVSILKIVSVDIFDDYPIDNLSCIMTVSATGPIGELADNYSDEEARGSTLCKRFAVST